MWFVMELVFADMFDIIYANDSGYVWVSTPCNAGARPYSRLILTIFDKYPSTEFTRPGHLFTYPGIFQVRGCHLFTCFLHWWFVSLCCVLSDRFERSGNKQTTASSYLWPIPRKLSRNWLYWSECKIYYYYPYISILIFFRPPKNYLKFL